MVNLSKNFIFCHNVKNEFAIPILYKRKKTQVRQLYVTRSGKTGLIAGYFIIKKEALKVDAVLTVVGNQKKLYKECTKQ